MIHQTQLVLAYVVVFEEFCYIRRVEELACI